MINQPNISNKVIDGWLVLLCLFLLLGTQSIYFRLFPPFMEFAQKNLFGR